MASSDNNPGTVLASAVDAEVAKYRELEESINQLRSDFQKLLGQAAENEMVLRELELIDGDSTNVYKMIGPALIKQNLEDAIQSVKRRLELIQSQQTKISEQINTKEKKANEMEENIQKMNQTLQQTTAQAVQAIAAEHQKQSA